MKNVRLLFFVSPGNTRQWFVLFGAILLLAVILFGSRGGEKSRSSQEVPGSDASVDAAVVEIIFGRGGARRAFRGPVVEGMTVADALRQSGKAGDFPVSFDAAGMPIVIDGVSGSWSIARNGESFDAPLTETPIVPGDEILFTPKGT